MSHKFQKLPSSLDRLLTLAQDAPEGACSFRAMAQAVGLDPAKDFRGASLRELDMRDEDLTGFDFSDADLSGCDFRRSKIEGCNFTNADLTGVIGLDYSSVSVDEPYVAQMKTERDNDSLQRKRGFIIDALSGLLGCTLTRRTRVFYGTDDNKIRVVCTLSKRFRERKSYQYWYAFHERWEAFLIEAVEGRLVLGCLDLDMAFSIPHEVIQDVLPKLNKTDAGGRRYWHLHIRQNLDTSDVELILPRGGQNVSLIEYKFEVPRNRNLD